MGNTEVKNAPKNRRFEARVAEMKRKACDLCHRKDCWYNTPYQANGCDILEILYEDNMDCVFFKPYPSEVM